MSKSEDSASAAPINKYQEYQKKCVELLNKLITPCPKVNDPKDDKEPGKGPIDPGGKSSIDDLAGKGSDGKDPQDQGSDKSSTVLKHNGQVGSLEELIVFLIKAPTNNDLKMKLNDVYKIFNPTARDIVSKQPDQTPSPSV